MVLVAAVPACGGGGSNPRDGGSPEGGDRPSDAVGSTEGGDRPNDTGDRPSSGDAPDVAPPDVREAGTEVAPDRQPDRSEVPLAEPPPELPPEPRPETPPEALPEPPLPEPPSERPDGPDAADCGAGCPQNVQPQALGLWLQSDWGAVCNQDSPPRITSWADRARPPRSFSPAATKVGPRCDGPPLAGQAVVSFDRPTADVSNGVLPIDLSSLVNHDYTVFVVERRQSPGARYILGSDLPDIDTVGECDSAANQYQSYVFGYRADTTFGLDFVGFDANAPAPGCTDINVTIPAFTTARAALEVEVFSAASGHDLYLGTTLGGHSDDKTPLQALTGGFLGRGLQAGTGFETRYLGDIAEVVIYEVALSAADRLAVSGYLTTRWGVIP